MKNKAYVARDLAGKITFISKGHPIKTVSVMTCSSVTLFHQK